MKFRFLIFTAVISAVFLSLSGSPRAVAQVGMPSAPSTAGVAQGDILFGQNHYYTVFFRGNGEAIVTARLLVTNPNDQPLTEYSFEIPRITPTELSMYQQGPTCLRFDEKLPGRPCVQFRDETGLNNPAPRTYPYYDPDYYRGGGQTYTRINYTQSGTVYKLTLPNPIASQKTSTIVVTYAAMGYTKERFGLFTYNFSTIKVPDRTQQVQLAVDIDNELYIEGERSKIQYARQTETDVAASFGLGASRSISNPLFDNYVNEIGTGPIVKTAKALAPNESFIVEGKYARSWWRLHFASLAIAAVVVLVIAIGLWILYRRQRARVASLTSAPGTTATASGGPTSSDATMLSIIRNALWARFTIFLVVGLTIVGTWAPSLLDDYRYDPLIGLGLFLIVALLYVLAIFGPALWVSSKHGVKGFLGVLSFVLLWAVFFFFVYLMLRSSGAIEKPRPYPVYQQY